MTTSHDPLTTMGSASSSVMRSPEILLDADEVARRIGCTRRHVERLNADGEGPPSVKVGRRLRRYPETLFNDWIKKLVEGE
jgi:excisionase family DNA binding protein